MKGDLESSVSQNCTKADEQILLTALSFTLLCANLFVFLIHSFRKKPTPSRRSVLNFDQFNAKSYLNACYLSAKICSTE